MIKSTKYFISILTLLFTSVSCQNNASSHEMSAMLEGLPKWYSALILDLAELVDESLESSRRDSLDENDPNRIIYSDSNNLLHIDIDYNKQREILRSYPDSLTHKIWNIGHKSSLGDDNYMPVFELKLDGIFMRHIEEIGKVDTLIYELHEALSATGVSGLNSILQIVRNDVFDYNKVEHRYAFLMIAIVNNDWLKRSLNDFEGPKYFDPREHN